MEMIYYNFWEEKLDDLVKSFNYNRILNLQNDSYLPATEQKYNDSKLIKHFIENLSAYYNGADIWANILKPFWQDYLSRCGAIAPKTNIGNYLIEHSTRWQDHTIDILSQICNYYEPGTLDHFKVSHKVNECILQCNIDLALYRAQIVLNNNTPIAPNQAQEPNARPDPRITAKLANPKYYDKALSILSNQKLSRFYDSLFQMGAFSNNNGYWHWNSKYKAWQLVLVICIITLAVDNHRSGNGLTNLSDLENIDIHWVHFSGWIQYKNRSIDKSLRPIKNALLNKEEKDIAKDPIYLALVDSLNIQNNPGDE